MEKPGIYTDDLISKTASKKRRVSHQNKMQPSKLENYEFKVLNIFEKQQKETDKLHNKVKYHVQLARPQKDQLTKKELIEKLVNQMQNHLSEKEKELFETPQECDAAYFQKRKSQFYQEQSHLAMLESMKERFEQQQELQKKQQEDKKRQLRLSQCDESPVNFKLYRKKSSLNNFESYQYEQTQIEHGQQEYHKLQRIKKNVEKELTRMGLIEQQGSDYKLKSRKISLLGNNQTMQTSMQLIDKPKSQSKSNPKTYNTNNVLRRIKEKITFSHTHYSTLNTNNSMSTLITNCDQEIAQLKQIETDLTKKKKVQIKKFKIIQSDLDAIGFMRFQKTKEKSE